MIAGVVLAAGRSSRFGAIKVLAPFNGRPLIHRPISALTESGLDEVIVVVGSGAEAVEEELAGIPGCRPILCERWAEGQSRSLQAGLDAAAEVAADAAVVVLGDQPLLEAAAVERVIAHRSPAYPAVRASYAGIAGHPVLLESHLWPQISGLDGDQGAQSVLNAGQVLEVPCDGLGSDADVDAKEDLERLRSTDP